MLHNVNKFFQSKLAPDGSITKVPLITKHQHYGVYV